MSYVVLARKWRPAQFSDIVGQSHIVRTLMNAIRSQRIHQAYLFTGSRGIGKTSIARIFAKVLRCPEVKDDPVLGLRSCDQCPSCLEIARGTGIDVLEMDGASNNGVDAIREIRENAKYMPATGSRKIIIIDEVHMLTTAAFNALLKTLEEPPAHVVFIFATTEPHKIPATILSRLQRFDYRRVTVPQIQTRLAEVLAAEKISAEPAALPLIARAADGSMRDSLSLLDQIIAYSGERITVEAVRESIGLIGGDFLLAVLRAVYERKAPAALTLVAQADAQGHDLRLLARGILDLLHATLLVQVGASVESMELSEEEIAEVRAISQLRPKEETELLFQVIHYGIESIARSPQPRFVLDVLLVKCAAAEVIVALDRPQLAVSSPVATQATTEISDSVELPAAPPVAVRATAPHAAVSAPVVAAPAPFAPAKPANPFAAAPAATPQAVTPVVAVTAVAPAVHKPATAPTGPASWEGLVAVVRTKRPLLASILEHGALEKLPSSAANAPEEETALTLVFSPENSYYKEQLQARIYVEQLLTIARDYFGQPRLRVQLETREGAQAESLAAKRENQVRESERLARDAAAQHPIIREAQALFGADVGPIEVIHGNA